MAFVLEVLIVDGGDQTIKVGHSFYGLSRAEVETYKREHLDSCEYFKTADREGRTIEEIEEIPDEDLPDAEADDDEEEDR